jgi:hypothetical protein
MVTSSAGPDVLAAGPLLRAIGHGDGWRCRRLSRWSRVWVLLRTPAAVYPRVWRLCGRVRSFSCADDGSRRPPGREGRLPATYLIFLPPGDRDRGTALRDAARCRPRGGLSTCLVRMVGRRA